MKKNDKQEETNSINKEICPRCMKEVKYDNQIRCFSCGFMLLGEDGYLKVSDILSFEKRENQNS